MINKVFNHGQKMLVMVCSYRGLSDNAEPSSFQSLPLFSGFIGSLADKILLLNFRKFISRNRDFYANPKSFSYQVSLVNNLLAGLDAACEVDVRIDSRFKVDFSMDELDQFNNVNMVTGNSLGKNLNAYDSVLLVYPDPLGLQWGPLERSLLGRNTYILNGRSRFFKLDLAVHLRLVMHRILSNTRIAEIVFASIIVLMSPFLFLLDYLRGKK